MDESALVKLLVVTGVLAIALNAFSLSLLSDIEAKSFRDFTVPLLCFENNGTYFLAMPTSGSFCKRIFDLQLDLNEMMDSCGRYYAGEDYDSCAGLVDAYAKRTEDCIKYASTNQLEMSSVDNSELEAYCDALVSRSSGENPTGLWMTEIFRGIAGRRTAG